MDHRLMLVPLPHIPNLSLESRGLNQSSNTKKGKSYTIIVLKLDYHKHAMLVLVVIAQIKNNINKVGITIKSSIQGCTYLKHVMGLVQFLFQI